MLPGSKGLWPVITIFLERVRLVIFSFGSVEAAEIIQSLIEREKCEGPG